MQNPSHPKRRRILYQRTRVVFGFAGVNNDWTVKRCGESELVGKGRTLPLARRVVIMIVQSTFADGDGARRDRGLDPFAVCGRLVGCGVMRVHAGSAGNECGVSIGQRARTGRGVPRFPDANQSDRASSNGCLDDPLPISVECTVGEVGVAVDERQPPWSPRA